MLWQHPGADFRTVLIQSLDLTQEHADRVESEPTKGNLVPDCHQWDYISRYSRRTPSNEAHERDTGRDGRDSCTDQTGIACTAQIF